MNFCLNNFKNYSLIDAYFTSLKQNSSFVMQITKQSVKNKEVSSLERGSSYLPAQAQSQNQPSILLNRTANNCWNLCDLTTEKYKHAPPSYFPPCLPGANLGFLPRKAAFQSSLASICRGMKSGHRRRVQQEVQCADHCSMSDSMSPYSVIRLKFCFKSSLIPHA